MTHDAPQHLDWDTACLRCGKELSDDDEVVALDLAFVGDTAYGVSWDSAWANGAKIGCQGSPEDEQRHCGAREM